MSAVFQKSGILAASRAFGRRVCSDIVIGSPFSSPFGSRSHLLGHQIGTKPTASRTSRNRFMRPNRSWRASSGDRRTMVRYEMFRWQDLTGRGSRPQVGSRWLCVPNSMQLLAPTVAFAATLGRGISAVRFKATLATSLLAAGLRTVAVTAVAGLAQDHLAPAQLAIEQPTLETHPPTPPCKGAWDSQLPEIRQSGRNPLLAPTPHRPVFRIRSISHCGPWPRPGSRRDFRCLPPCPDPPHTLAKRVRPAPRLSSVEGCPDVHQAQTTGSVPGS